MVPLPSAAAESIIAVLQRGSTEAANGLFALTGVPYIREGFIFHLSTISVEVAEQCSGIRSSLALFITSVLAGHLFLKTGWKKVVLVLSIFPITVFKNGLRIVTLTLLGVYVDERILSSALHQRGGIPFFMLALLLWAPVLWLLRRTERRTDSGNKD
jgi:exosortase